MNFDEYAACDLVGLAELIDRGEVSAAEVAEAAITRTCAVDAAVNAVASPLFDAARASLAEGMSGRFVGAPFAIKDLNHAVSGAPLTNGSRAFAGNMPQEEAELPARYRAAGLVPIAITTSPELGLAVTTESALHGATRNPWDLGRSAGGSSGGAAALVAAGALPAAHATDGGGSIRIPAACCGLFGLKPSRGRTPVGTGRTEGWSGLTAAHAVTRSVRDSAVLLDVTHGAPFGSRIAEPAVTGSFLSTLDSDPAPLRIAVQTAPFDGSPVHPDVSAALEDAARLCSDLGHEVEYATPGVPDLTAAMLAVVATHIAATLQEREATIGRSLREDEVEPITRAFREHGRAASATDFVAAVDAFGAAGITMATFHQRYDILLTPVLGQPPAPIGTVSLDRSLEDYAAAMRGYSPFTSYQNMTGQPAMSVPLHWSPSGLPIGVQFVAAFGAERLLFALAGQLERARPWARRRPAMGA